jgi:sRNA-binding protein
MDTLMLDEREQLERYRKSNAERQARWRARNKEKVAKAREERRLLQSDITNHIARDRMRKAVSQWYGRSNALHRWQTCEQVCDAALMLVEEYSMSLGEVKTIIIEQYKKWIVEEEKKRLTN